MSMLSQATSFHEGLRFEAPDTVDSPTPELGIGPGLIPEETVVAGAACTVWREEPAAEEPLTVPENTNPISGSYI